LQAGERESSFQKGEEKIIRLSSIGGGKKRGHVLEGEEHNIRKKETAPSLHKEGKGKPALGKGENVGERQ